MRQSLERSRQAASKIGSTASELTAPLLNQADAILAAIEGSTSKPNVTKGAILAFSMKCNRRGNAVTRAFGRLLRRLGINGRRRLGFYTLRHTFRTVADATKDFPAIRLVMGHSSDGQIDGTYVERIDDARLRAVTDHVRVWLFGSEGGEGRPRETEAEPAQAASPEADSAAEDRPALRLYIA